jgi:hypothetical protein
MDEEQELETGSTALLLRAKTKGLGRQAQSLAYPCVVARDGSGA